MGLFFNYDKPGPGVEKDGPKKKGVFLYLELFWRKLGKLFLSNMLFALVSLPVLLVYHFISFYIMSAIMPESIAQNSTIFTQLVLLFAVLLAVLWGAGPVTCGYTFLLRNFAREEHVWLTSDFFEHIRKNFKQSLVIFIVDLLVLVFGTYSIYFYWTMSASVAAFRYIAYALVVTMMIYTIMHFYMYEFMVTFKVRIIDVYKNALIMTFAAFPMNLLLLVFAVVCSYLAFSFLTPVAIVLVAVTFWISFMRFPIDFYAARIIKREIIDRKERDE